MHKKTKEKSMIGSWLQSGDITIAEIIALSGFDFIVIDLEHSVIELNKLQPLFAVIEKHNAIPMIRLSATDAFVQARRALDAGAKGIIVPNVSSAEDAQKMLSSVKYPPKGKRGVGIYRAHGFGASFDKYFNTINKEMVFIVQIESKEGVDNVDEILDTEGVDGAMIGPYDMSASFGIIGNFKHPKMLKAQDIVKKAAIKRKKFLGTHVVWPEPGNVKQKVREGFNFIVYSSDIIMCHYYFKKDILEIKKILKMK